MTAIKKFEDIHAWQEARIFAKRVYVATREGAWAADYCLRDQARRSAISVMSNIAEGFGRDGTTEFKRFLQIAKASACELKSQFYIALDLDYINGDVFADLYEHADKTARMIGSLMHYRSRQAATINETQSKNE